MSLEITEAEFQRLVKFMYDNFGINLAEKKVLIQGRLSNMLTERGFKNYNDYIDAVLADKTGAEVNTILNKLTTNHTFFMREPEHYTFLNDVILPYMEKTCAHDHVIRARLAPRARSATPRLCLSTNTSREKRESGIPVSSLPTSPRT